MDLGIPLPRLDADAARDVGRLVERCLAHLAAPGDVEIERDLRDSEAALRRGPNLRPGEILERRFLLLEPRPAGSLAGCWRGFDLLERVPVAIRVLHPQHLFDPILRERFASGPAAQERVDLEAAHAGLPSPVSGVVRAEGEWSGFAFAVFEGGGAPLAASLGRLDLDARLELLLEVVEATRRLHALGVAHGALSLESVQLADGGEVRLIDVGSYGGASVGLFVAPESADPAWTATPASDVYLLGLLALTLLRDAPLPYWVVRDPQGVIDELPDLGDAGRAAEIKALLARTLHWRSELRPSVDELHRALLGGFDQQLALAKRAADRGRHALAVARFEALAHGRPVDSQLRRELSRALAAVGRAGDASRALADAILLASDESGDLTAELAELRRLVGETGDPDPYVQTLETLSREGCAGREVALLDLARFRGDSSADWERVLAAHRTRAQAREALERLVGIARAAGDARRVVRHGRDLSAYLDEGPVAADLARALGKTFLEDLGDPDNGLLWLDRALVGAHPDPELPAVVRRLRTARGDWEKTVDLLEQEAGRTRGADRLALLRAAADTARWATWDDDRAFELCAHRAELDAGDDDARRHLARGASAGGHHERAARALGALQAPTPVDACRAIDAWLGCDRREDALERVLAARERWPTHVGLLQRALTVALKTGTDDLAQQVAAALIDEVGPGGAGRRDALLVLGDGARARGELEAAARWYQEVLLDEALDSAAWWGLVQVAWVAGRTNAEPAWLRAAPRRLPPQEALARMIGGLVDAHAVMAWLARVAGEVSTETSRLERAGEVVNHLVSRGLVDARFFEELADLAGEEHDAWVEAVRRLWDGSGRSDVAFPVAAAHTWCPVDGPDHFRRTHRLALGTVPSRPTRPPDGLGDSDRRAELLVKEEVLGFSEEGEPPVQLELEGRPALLSEAGGALRVDRPVSWLRVGPDGGLEATDVASARIRLEHRCGRVYLIADPPIEVAGRSVHEARLEHDVDLSVDGRRVRFVADLSESRSPWPSVSQTFDADPDGDPLSVEEVDRAARLDEPTIEAIPDDGQIRAALFYRLDGAERILPLAADRILIGPEPDAALKLGAGSGWLARIERPMVGIWQIEVQGVSGPGGPGVPKLLTQGERFAVAGVEFEFQLVEARTPAPAPSRLERGARVPALVVDDGNGERTVTLQRDLFTIGRGRTNHLQLAADGKLSRHHCSLILGPGGVVLVRDNHSSNGTTVNGEPVTERELTEGDVIELGDSRLVFGYVPKTRAPVVRDDPTPDAAEDLLLADTAIRPRSATSVSVTEGRAKLQAANEALALVGEALDRAAGSGNGQANLQLLLDAASKRFAPLFAGVEARSSGLPEMVVLYNLAQRPPPTQRLVLNQALLDLVERTVSQALEVVPSDEADELLEGLSRTKYREHLRF